MGNPPVNLAQSHEHTLLRQSGGGALQIQDGIRVRAAAHQDQLLSHVDNNPVMILGETQEMPQRNTGTEASIRGKKGRVVLRFGLTESGHLKSRGLLRL